MEHLGYLIAAYLIFALLMTVYIFSIHQRGKETQRMLEKLKRQKS